LSQAVRAPSSGVLLADRRELLLGLLVALGVGEHPLLRVEVTLGVVDQRPVGPVVLGQPLLALGLDLLVGRLALRL
jgi:hypothetical protein